MTRIICATWLLPLAALVVVDAAEVEKPKDVTAPQRQAALTVQLFLDAEGFGPGRLDAWWGEFTRKAAVRWNEAHPDRRIELTEQGEPTPESVNQLGWDQPLTVEYTIREEDARNVGELPERPAEKAKLDSLPYTSLMELVAEKFHAYPELIRELNQLDRGTVLRVGQRLKVPNVAEPFDLAGPREAGEESGHADGEIHIDRAKEILEYRVDGEIRLSFPITPGAGDNPAPAGEWMIEVIAWMPEFRYDESMLEDGVRSDEGHLLPPGPNSPVGIVWMGINKDGIGLHGTSEPDTIGRSASHGCIRLSNWDAYLLGRKVAVNTKVFIQ